MRRNNLYKFIAVVIMAALFSMKVMAQSSAEQLGMTMTAHEWCQAVKAGWNLGNSFESSSSTSNRDLWETGWGNPVTTKEMISKVKELGFNAIRIPVRWEPHCSDHATMNISTKWLNRVKEVVDWCLEEDMYVIINTHHEEWLEQHPTNANKDENIRMLKALWTNIATAFKDYDQRLAFAGINEVQVNWQRPTTEHASVENAYNQAFVETVRATGGKNEYRNLIIQTYSCSPYYGRDFLTIPTDPTSERLSVEFHYYDPYDYCSGNGKYYYWGSEAKAAGKSVPNDNENTINNLFKDLKTRWYDKGLGVIIGEYGVSDHYTAAEKDEMHANNTYYLKKLVSYIRQYGFAGFVWDNNVFGNGTEKFGILDRRNKMNPRANYFYQGIMEGAGIDYDPTIGGDDTSETDTEYGDNATIIWQGESDLAWGSGLQLNITAADFADFTTNHKIVVFCKKKAMKENYDMLQLVYGGWASSPSFFVNGTKETKEFNPSSYSSDANNIVLELTFDQATINTLKQKGLVIQGYGLTLTKVLKVAPKTDGIVSVTANESKAGIYDLNGMLHSSISGNGIYIINGKKTIVSNN